jgi:hypothetical protein
MSALLNSLDIKHIYKFFKEKNQNKIEGKEEQILGIFM